MALILQRDSEAAGDGRWIEGRIGDVKGEFQDGSIDVMTMEDVAGWKDKVAKVMKG